MTAARSANATVPRPAEHPMPSDHIVYLMALRYAMGRRSSAVTNCARVLRDDWPRIEARVRELILRELREEIARQASWMARHVGDPHTTNPGPLGDPCDVAVWLDLEVRLSALEKTL